MKPDSIVIGFVDYLKSDGKTELLPEISHQLDLLAQKMDDTKKVVVTSAVQLTQDEKESLKKLLAQIFKHDVEEVENRIDPELIGGLRIYFGDILIDATVRGQLEYMKKTLLV